MGKNHLFCPKKHVGNAAETLNHRIAEWPPLHQPGPSEEAPRPPNRRGCGELLGDQMGFFGGNCGIIHGNIWKYHGRRGKLNMVSMVLWYFLMENL